MSGGDMETNISNDETERLEFEAEVNAYADKVFSALEKARSKMTPEKRERAIRNSEAILGNYILNSLGGKDAGPD